MSTADSMPPKPISQMATWDFWASPFALGLSREDAEAIARGDPMPEQIDRMMRQGDIAKNALISATVNQALVEGTSDVWPDLPEPGRPS